MIFDCVHFVSPFGKIPELQARAAHQARIPRRTKIEIQYSITCSPKFAIVDKRFLKLWQVFLISSSFFIIPHYELRFESRQKSTTGHDFPTIY